MVVACSDSTVRGLIKYEFVFPPSVKQIYNYNIRLHDFRMKPDDLLHRCANSLSAHRLQEMGISDCGSLQEFPLSTLKNEFGAKTGQKLHDMSCGVDCREVVRGPKKMYILPIANFGTFD